MLSREADPLSDELCVLSAAVFTVLLALPLLSQNPAPDAPRFEGSVIAPGAALAKLAGGFAFTEGPPSDSSGTVCFTDQPNDRILKWSVDGTLSTFLEPAGRPNGMYCGAGGTLYLTGKGVSVFDATGKKIGQIDVPETLDRECQLRREGSPDALHHGRHGPLRHPAACQGRERSEMTGTLSSASVTRPGAQASIPARAEVDALRR